MSELKVRGGRAKTPGSVNTLFLDVGGVLLTNGWDHRSRELAAEKFGLDLDEMNELHRLTYDLHEAGKIPLDEYLDRVVFYRKRPFTRARFRQFMFDQSRPYPEMIELVRRLKARYRLKIFVVSNEGRELNAHRFHKFGLDQLVDCFISSCYVGLRKPDMSIWRLALDVSQTPVEQIVYVENTPMFVQLAQGLGIRGILHTDYQSTCQKLAELGLSDREGAENVKS